MDFRPKQVERRSAFSSRKKKTAPGPEWKYMIIINLGTLRKKITNCKSQTGCSFVGRGSNWAGRVGLGFARVGLGFTRVGSGKLDQNNYQVTDHVRVGFRLNIAKKN
jgi:hypothetical protein